MQSKKVIKSMPRKLHFYYIIMRLGGWESLDMALRYTRSVRFEESLRVFRRMG